MVEITTLFKAIGSATSGVFTNTFGFLFNEILTPLIVIGLVALLIYGQYKLVQFYIYLGRVVIPYIQKLLNFILMNDDIRNLIKPLLEKFNVNEKTTNN